ncbi:MAG: hypothetical protein DI607_01400 [Sphingomonas hengshuiensis]|nr:MAG: hypothetical protein DI607_01400 [Sphingomonas hengshuiensis]
MIYDNDQFPWDELDQSASCTVTIGEHEFRLYVGELPDLGLGECAWSVRWQNRYVATGIAPDMGHGIARAELAAKNWADRDWRIFEGTQTP